MPAMCVGRPRRPWFCLSFLFAFLGAARGAESFSSVLINEVVSVNRTGLPDEDGERHGWIELYNAGLSPVNLNGWLLADSPTNPAPWRFPRVTLLPDKYLLVFASGKARAADPSRLHANFRLAPEGGTLVLLDRASNIVSALAGYPALPADTAHGRVRGLPDVRGEFARPTPGKPNASQGAGFAPEVTFSHPDGNFTEPFALRLTAGVTGAVIRYTLDGTWPVLSSPVWPGSLLVTNTTHVRARAWLDGHLPGPPSSAAWIKLFTNVLEFTSDLPVLVLDTFGKNVSVSERTSFVRVSMHEPVQGRSSLTNPPGFTSRAAFRVRGSTSSGMPQQGFALEFIDEFNQEKEQALLGLPADSDWILYAPNAYDPVLIHNPFVHQLSRDLGRYSPRTRFVEVFLVRGAGRVRQTHYNGLYVLEEKIKVSPHRVAIDRIGPGDLTPPQVSGGYLLKIDRLGPDEGGFDGAGAGLVYVEPKESVMLQPQRAAQRKFLQKFFADYDHALNGPEWRDPVAGYRAVLDVDAAIDFHVLEVLSGNVDALVLSTYLHLPRGGKVTFGPHWDFDRALGSTDGRDENPRQWNTGPFFGGAWWPRLFTDPDFWQLWVDRWQELRQTHFSLTHLNALIDRLAAEIREAQPRQYARWEFQPRGGSYAAEIRHMKHWLSNRLDFIDGQLTPPPRLERAGRTVTLVAPVKATIHYTLDGSDPRAAQGAVNTNSIAYTGPFQIPQGARLIARARDPARRQRNGPPVSTPWSRRVEAR